MDEIVDEAGLATTTVKKQMEAVEQTFKSILGATEEITTKLEKMYKLSETISELKGKSQNSMDTVSSISQNSAAASEEISATTEEQIAAATQLADLARNMSNMADELKTAVERFKIG